MPYRTSRYFSYRSLNRYRNMLVSYRFKYRTVPDYTGCTGENRTFRPKIETRTVPKKKKKNILITCTVILQSLTHCQLLLPPLLLHLCPSIKAASSSPCPSINFHSSLYTFLALSASDDLINVNE